MRASPILYRWRKQDRRRKQRGHDSSVAPRLAPAAFRRRPIQSVAALDSAGSGRYNPQSAEPSVVRGSVQRRFIDHY
jgi:hypothetical protein